MEGRKEVSLVGEGSWLVVEDGNLVSERFHMQGLWAVS